MASAATTGLVVGNLPNAACILSSKVNLASNSNDTPIIAAITDDISEQASLRSVIGREGWRCETFESVQEFLLSPRPVVPTCLILALSLPGLTIIEVQRQIALERAEVPVIVLADYGDVSTTVQAMKAGAMDFLLKPLNNDALVGAIRESLERSRLIIDRETQMRDLRRCHASLSRRERQVMTLVVSCLLNKQVGGELGISEITVKAHRRQVMQKMKANSLADLVRMAGKLQAARQYIFSA